MNRAPKGPTPPGPGKSAARALRRTAERTFKPGVGGRRPNQWPAGTRATACLLCEQLFVSSGRQERMCPACRRRSL